MLGEIVLEEAPRDSGVFDGFCDTARDERVPASVAHLVNPTTTGRTTIDRSRH
jgi:hypothetical protein